MSDLEQKYYEATGTMRSQEEIKEDMRELLLNSNGAPVMIGGMTLSQIKEYYRQLAKN